MLNLKKYNKNKNWFQMYPVPPGKLQYDIDIETLQNFDLANLINDDYKDRFNLEQHTKENFNRLCPDTKTGNKYKKDWKILFIIKQKNNNEILLKGALINKKTNKIALLSSINKEIQKDYPYRLLKSFDKDYKICQCKMIAPLFFWDELQNRINN